jgi:hyperosmotically inducible protein
MRTLLVRAIIVFVCAFSVGAARRADAGGQANRPSQVRSADEWVTTQIQAKYFLDPDIKARTVDVSTISGVVTLSGRVATAQERERASEIASRVAGVRNVENRLTVERQDEPAGTSGQTPPPPTDSQMPGSDEIERVTHSDPVILSQIKAKYAVDPEVSAIGVDVDVESGIVTLRGEVTGGSIRQRAEALAREVPGVKNVKNELKVKQ